MPIVRSILQRGSVGVRIRRDGPPPPPSDTVPDAFAFVPVIGAVPSTYHVANAQILGIDAATPAVASGGEIARNAVMEEPATWGTTLSVLPHDYLFVRALSSATLGGYANAVVTVGGVEVTFSVQTRRVDWFAWNDAEGSAFLLDHPANAVVVGDTFAVNPWHSSWSDTTGNAVALAPATSADYDGDMGLNPWWRWIDFDLGGWQEGMERDAYLSSYVRVHANVTATITGGEFGLSASTILPGTWTTDPLTVDEGSYLHVRVKSANAFETWANATVTIADTKGARGTGTLVTRTRASDVSVDPFAFTSVVGAARSRAYVASAPITGILDPVTASTTAGEIAASATSTAPVSGWTTDSLTVAPNSYLFVRLTSIGAFSTATVATVTVGDQSATFSVTTQSYDNTPDPFALVALAGVEANETFTSTAVRVTGVNGPTDVSTTLGQIATSATSTAPATGWTANTISVSNGAYIFARMTSAADLGTTATATITVGTDSADWTITTRPSGPNWMAWGDASGGAYTLSPATSAILEGDAVAASVWFTWTDATGTAPTLATPSSATFTGDDFATSVWWNWNDA